MFRKNKNRSNTYPPHKRMRFECLEGSVAGEEKINLNII